MAKTTVKTPTPAKTTRKPAKATPAPVAKREPRYLRAARAIIEIGGDPADIDPHELAEKADMSPSSASYCLEAYQGVVQALREGGLLKRPVSPAKAPTAPSKPTTQPQPEPVAADA